jgi:hypothetical protein
MVQCRVLAIGVAAMLLPAVASGTTPEVIPPLASTPLMAVLQAAPAVAVSTESAVPTQAVETRRGPLAGRFLIGATTSIAVTPAVDLGSTWRISPFIRNTPRRSGWGPSFGLSWFRGELRVPVNGQSVTVGEVKVRPVMAGVSYAIIRGRTITSLSVVAGYAFNRARVTAALPDGTSVSARFDSAWAMRPNVGLTFALRPRLALVGGFGYVYSKPRLMIDIDRAGQPRESMSVHQRSDYVAASAGLAFSVF